MTTRPVSLITRRSKAAPRFDIRNPLSLWDYFVDYEILAEAAHLDEATKIKKSVIYLSHDEADVWESLDEYLNANDWQGFKKAVLSFYPGSIPKDRWTLVELSALGGEQKTKRIQTRGDFAEFYRRFSIVSKSLIRKGLVSELEAKKLFWSALDQDFKDRLVRKIELTKPAYTSRTILTIAEIRSAASLVLDGTPAETSSVASKDVKTSTPVLAQLEPREAESFDMERFAQQMSIMMAQIVEIAISSAFDQVSSMHAPPVQKNVSDNRFGASYLAHVNPIISAYPRNQSLQRAYDAHDHFSNTVTAASSNANVHETSPNLVKVKNISPVETPVESKADLNAYIEALQWRISRQEDDDGEEGLEDVIRVLKTRVKKKTLEHGTSHRGPQEKRVVPPFVAPSIPARATTPSKAAPESPSFPVPPILKVVDYPYCVQTPRKVVVEPADAFEPSQSVALSVEELLTLFPDVRKYFQDATTTRQMVNLKKDKAKVAPVSTVAVYLAAEASVAYSEGAHTTPSKPREALVEEPSTGRGVVTKSRNLKNRSEEVSCREELSRRRIVLESSKERYCSSLFPMFSDVIESHRIKESPMYSQPPPVELSTVSSMCLIAPPVSACHSIIANLPTVAVAKSFVVETNRRRSEVKEYRREMKKLVQPFRYPRNGGLVYLGTFRIVLPARPHPSKLPNGEEFIARAPSLRLMPSPKSQNQPLCLVGLSTNHVAPQPINDTSTINASVVVQDEKKTHRGKPVSVLQLSQSILLISAFVLHILRRHPFIVNASARSPDVNELRLQVLKKNVPSSDDPENGELVQLDTAQINVLASAYLETLPNEESSMHPQKLDSMSSPLFTNPHAFLIELPICVAATFLANGPSFTSASQWDAEMKMSCRRFLKTLQLICKARSEVLVQLELYRIVVPCRPYPEKLPIEERYARTRLHPTFASQFKSPRVFVLELSTSVSAVQSLDEVPMSSVLVMLTPETTTFAPIVSVQFSTLRLHPASFVLLSSQAKQLPTQSERPRGHKRRTPQDVEWKELSLAIDSCIRIEQKVETKLFYLEAMLDDCSNKGRNPQPYENSVVHRYSPIRAVYPSTLYLYHLDIPLVSFWTAISNKRTTQWSRRWLWWEQRCLKDRDLVGTLKLRVLMKTTLHEDEGRLPKRRSLRVIEHSRGECLENDAARTGAMTTPFSSINFNGISDVVESFTLQRGLTASFVVCYSSWASDRLLRGHSYRFRGARFLVLQGPLASLHIRLAFLISLALSFLSLRSLKTMLTSKIANLLCYSSQASKLPSHRRAIACLFRNRLPHSLSYYRAFTMLSCVSYSSFCLAFLILIANAISNMTRTSKTKMQISRMEERKGIRQEDEERSVVYSIFSCSRDENVCIVGAYRDETRRTE